VTRFALPENEAKAGEPHVPYVFLCEFDFASGFFRANTSNREYSHLSNTFIGAGFIGAIGQINESDTPEKLEFQLPADQDLVTAALTENYHGRDVRIYLALLDDAYQYVATPELRWEGFMDTMQIRRDVNSALITLICEDWRIILEESSGVLYADAHQQLHAPGDLFFNQVAKINNTIIKWGEQNVNTGTLGPRGRPNPNVRPP
jgi:hypothetical protein